jgi:transcriptional regulator with XRE-family HTH domain
MKTMKPGTARVRESLSFQVLAGPPSTAGTGRSLVVMDNRNEIRDFLTSRRARITPEQAGLLAYGGNRRVAGLRREEVAMLAGVSVDYYTRLERGNARGASDAVLDGLARALHLDEAERAHLFDLVHAANTSATRAPRRAAKQHVRPSVQRILDSMTTTPAYVRNGRLDILAANRLGYALFSPVFDSPARPANLARFLFLDSRATEFYTDWERHAQDTVALLRSEAGRDPHDRALSDLIGELSTRSEAFRAWWAAHNVRFHRSGVKRFRHPVVGDLTLTYEAIDLAADAGLRISAYTAEPGTPSHDALNLLASWAATLDQAEDAERLRR